MTGKLQHFTLVCVAVLAVWAGLLVGTTVLMEALWAIWSASSPHRYDVAMRTIFNIYLLVIWVGVLPAYVLRRMHVRNVAAYLAAGIGSALLAAYTLVMAMDFGIPLAFCCVHNPSLPDLFVFVFTDDRHVIRSLVETNGYSSIAALVAPGVFWSLVAWRLLRPKLAAAKQA